MNTEAPNAGFNREDPKEFCSLIIVEGLSARGSVVFWAESSPYKSTRKLRCISSRRRILNVAKTSKEQTFKQPQILKIMKSIGLVKDKKVNKPEDLRYNRIILLGDSDVDGIHFSAQVRGSIPLLWQQIVDLTYKPKFELLKVEEAPRVLERHFLDLRKKYGAVLAVDLVNKHGGEGRLCEKFGNTVQQVASDDVRYLLLNEKGEKMKEQLGVVRTNCIDCLDRTNVTQDCLENEKLNFCEVSSFCNRSHCKELWFYI